MKQSVPNPAILNFLAGVAASAFVSLFLAITTSGEADKWRFAAAAAPWGVTSACLSLAAHLLEGARRETDLLITPNLTRANRKEIVEGAMRGIRTHMIILVIFGVLGLIGGVGLIWFLFEKSAGG